MLSLTICTCVLVAILILLYKERFSRAGRLINAIPGPKSWPIIGNTANYTLPPEKLFPYQLSLFRDYGHINQIHGINTRMVNIDEPDDIEKITSQSKYNTKSYIYKFLIPWLGEGILISDGQKWHQRRKLMTKSFHFQILKEYTKIFIKKTEYLLREIQNRIETESQEINLMPLISNSTLSIICEASMGISLQQDVESIMRKYLNSILIVGECFAKRMGNVWMHFESIFKLSNTAKAQRDALMYLHGFTNKVINEKRSLLTKENYSNESVEIDCEITYENNKKVAMLDLLLKSEQSGLIDHNGIREEVDTIMFEGHDTTAMALTFMIMTIANEPHVQDKIYEEMQKIFGESQRLPTMEDLNEMNYLDCCIKESLRLYPPVVYISRQLREETVLSGYTVPADTMCLIHIFNLHHRADLYPEPDRYIPERFLPENCVNRHHYAYMPFSAGPRNCIGQKFAMLEMKTMMSGLLRKFRLEAITKHSDIVFKSDIILRSVNPIYVQFTLRE